VQLLHWLTMMLSLHGIILLEHSCVHSQTLPSSLCRVNIKGKLFPYLFLSVGCGADPSVHAICPQVTKPSTLVGCHYFPPP